jgi:glycosyltransferase involved in cell wall biosynthesis
MRVLIVSKYFPADPRTHVRSVFQRMNMFVDAIKEIAHINMLFYVPFQINVSPPLVSALERSFSEHWNTEIRLFLCQQLKRENSMLKQWIYISRVCSFFKQPYYVSTSEPQQVQALESCLRNKPDAIFAHRLSAMCPHLLSHETLPPIFFDLDDIEHVRLIRSIKQSEKRPTNLLKYLYVPALCWGEIRAIRLARRTFVCSELDRRYLAKYWHLPGVVAIPNAVTIPAVQPLTSEPTLLFLGSYKYQPNLDAAEFLVKQVWPRVYRAMPTARLIIAGAPPQNVHGYGLNIPGVEFTGFVEDLGGLYRRSRVVCAPIFAGGGTRVKIVEAAAYGKPIVATQIGAEGLEMRNGHELLLREDPVSFAEACLKLLTDAALCERLGAAARAIAVQRYDRAKVVRLIQRYLTS